MSYPDDRVGVGVGLAKWVLGLDTILKAGGKRDQVLQCNTLMCGIEEPRRDRAGRREVGDRSCIAV